MSKIPCFLCFIWHPPSPVSRDPMPMGLLKLAYTSLGSEHLPIFWHPANHASVPGPWGVAYLSSAQMCGGEEAILLSFLLCKNLVGTGFSSPQLAKVSSTKLEVWLWERLSCRFSWLPGDFLLMSLPPQCSVIPKARNCLQNGVNPAVRRVLRRH